MQQRLSKKTLGIAKLLSMVLERLVLLLQSFSYLSELKTLLSVTQLVQFTEEEKKI